jgi:hypothetical protein
VGQWDWLRTDNRSHTNRANGASEHIAAQVGGQFFACYENESAFHNTSGTVRAYGESKGKVVPVMN